MSGKLHSQRQAGSVFEEKSPILRLGDGMKDGRLPADAAGVYSDAAIDQKLGCTDSAVLRGYVQERGDLEPKAAGETKSVNR